MESSEFSDLSLLEKSLKKDADLKLSSAHWLQTTADDPTTVRVRRSHNVLQPWEQDSIARQIKGVKNRCEVPFSQPAKSLS
jgi:hypothetical protein